MAKTKAVVPVKTLDQIKDRISGFRTGYDSRHVLEKADKELGDNNGEQLADSDTFIFKAMTVYEFNNGMLLATAISEQYKTLAIEMSRNLQKEFDCQSTAAKALAEIVTMNYVRTLDIQRRINNYLEKGTINEVGVRFLDVMSRELDRANRHYIQAVETLKVFKQPAMQLKISANTAVVGQNQVIQAANKQ
ncbi:hypothetical protein HYS95_00080 [Candidatus Daviesbacteria bacterium]|nr:hypothetical protein [Candidatus Daviesbacteria bacterium]